MHRKINMLRDGLTSVYKRRKPDKIGGDDRNRADDLFNAIESLFHLSYIPVSDIYIGGGCGHQTRLYGINLPHCKCGDHIEQSHPPKVA